MYSIKWTRSRDELVDQIQYFQNYNERNRTDVTETRFSPARTCLHDKQNSSQTNIIHPQFYVNALEEGHRCYKFRTTLREIDSNAFRSKNQEEIALNSTNNSFGNKNGNS